MFNHLLESHAPANRNPVGQVVSVVMHTCAIAIAVFATQKVVTAAASPPNEHIDFVAPPVPPPPPVVAPRDVAPPPPIPLGHLVLVAPIVIPDVLPAIDLTRPITDARDYEGSGAAGGRHDGDRGVTARPVSGDATYYAAQVEKPAAQVPGTGMPEYPEGLRAAGIEGAVRVEFVVDTTGKAEPQSVKILTSTHALFTGAVRNALAKMRFKPAETASHKVRQIVELPFVFSIR